MTIDDAPSAAPQKAYRPSRKRFSVQENHNDQRRRATVRILEADPAFARTIPAPDFARALSELTVPSVELDGDSELVAARLRLRRGELGWLVLDGAAVREVTVNGASFAELIGPGQIIGRGETVAGQDLVRHTVSWQVLRRLRLAHLDRHFTAALAAWPDLLVAIMERRGERASRLAVGHAVANIPRVDVRLIVALWLLAERWGRVVQEGVEIELKLSHRTLGSIIGAQRPTVTKALGELESRGLIQRRTAGIIVLSSPADLASAINSPLDDGATSGRLQDSKDLRERIRKAHELNEAQTERLHRQSAMLRQETERLVTEIRFRGRRDEGRADAPDRDGDR